MAREGAGSRATQDLAAAVRYAEREAGAVLDKTRRSVCGMHEGKVCSVGQDAAVVVW